jgi:hypothetical protein
MSITVGVDPVTFFVARVLTSAVFVGIGGLVALLAGEKVKIPKRPLWVLVALVGLGAGLGSFLAEWASVKLSLCVGLGVMIFGASLAFEKGATSKGPARLAGAIALLAVGAAWVGWNGYLMFR